MLPIGGRPILWHIMKIYAAHGIRDFVLCLGYKGWTIKEFFLNYRAMTNDLTVRLGMPGGVQFHENGEDEDWRVTLAETGEDAMTGARVAAIRRYVADDELFLMTYGDGVADIDIKASIAHHRAHGKIATVTAVRTPNRFGEMAVEEGRVREFNEKPRERVGYISGGFFVLDAMRIWPYLEGGSHVVFEQAPLRRLAEDGELMAYCHEGFWQPMDNYREYQMLNEIWASGRAPWAVPRRKDG